MKKTSRQSKSPRRVQPLPAVFPKGMGTATAAARRAEDGEAWFSALVNSMDDMVAVFNLDFRLIAIFGAWWKAHSIHSDSVVGKELGEVFSNSDVAVHDQACARVASGETCIYEWTLTLPASQREMHVTLSPHRNAAGEVKGLVFVGRDITEMKRAGGESWARDERIRHIQRVDALGRLAGGIAHDFNNILTIINGFGEMLEDDKTLSANAHASVEQITKAGERAAELTGQLLAFGRRQVMHLEVVNLNGIVSEMTTTLRSVIGENIELVTELDPAIGNVHVDKDQIGQVVLSIAANARDAMPNGGKLIIETSNVELSDKYSELHEGIEPGEFVQLVISDTGTGMDEAIVEKIFEPFFTTKGKGKGTGLGLSTVYGIVRQSGGHVGVYSELGKGTTFRVYLPRVDAQGVEARSKTASDDKLRGTETILLAEDEDQIREIATEMLRGYGYRVIPAADGDEAIAAYLRNAEHIDMVLTDVVMPNMNGPDVVRKLKAMGCEMRVLYMSGYTDMYLNRLGESGSGTGFIQKPFKPRELVRAVRNLLDRK